MPIGLNVYHFAYTVPLLSLGLGIETVRSHPRILTQVSAKRKPASPWDGLYGFTTPFTMALAPGP